MAGKKIYISGHIIIFQVIYMYYTVHDTSLQYAVTYNTLQVVVYPTNNRYLGILRLSRVPNGILLVRGVQYSKKLIAQFS
jgi:hypothetical protein